MYFGHDANMCLLEDGNPILVLEKERVTRVKHDLGHMHDIVLQKLREVSWDHGSIDMIVINPFCNPTADGIGYRWELDGAIYDQRPAYREPKWIGPPEERYSMHKLRFVDRQYECVAVDHHLAHIAGALFTSPFHESDILSADGGGDLRYCALGYGAGNRIEFIEYDWGMGRSKSYSQLNIGSAWNSIGCFNFGFKPLEGAGKLMGLASYASPTEILVDHVTRHAMFYWGSAFPSYLFDRKTKIDPRDVFAQQLAASLQQFTTKMFVLAAKRMKGLKETVNLCITGGCAMNCIANSAVHLGGLFKDTFVPAQPHDGGLALGQALFVWHHVLGNSRVEKPMTPFLGTDVGDLPISYVQDIVAALIQGKTVGVAFGKAESGPRALGHRSILADPRRSGIREHLNDRVKHREWFRPYAPIVLQEDYFNWFEEPVPSRYMSYTSTVRPDRRDTIPGIVHVDGTARTQIITQEEYPHFHALLSEWKRLTGVPVLLNTSFNSQEPLVDTKEDAYRTWARTELDILATPDGVFKEKQIPVRARAGQRR